jgi:hypothetical protein
MSTGVSIRYGGEIFNNVSGTPTPLLSVTTSANTDINNNILSFKYALELEGMVIGTGLQSCLSKYSGIVNYFSNPQKQGQVFEVLCNGSPVVSYGGTSFKQSTADKSNNNWVVTLPYTISLESFVPASGVSGLIESFEDNWTIEPLEEVYYTDYTKATPLNTLSSSAGSNSLDRPPSATILNASSQNISIKNTLQYRITHRLSAVGKAIDRTNTNNPAAGGSALTNNARSDAYIEAAKWVQSRLLEATKVSGTGLSIAPSNMYLYNHVRSIESNVSAGTYGVTDTWLGLPSGISFTEDFTWEISTDDKMIKTVSIQGTVKGLESVNNSGYTIFPSSALTGTLSSGVLPVKFINQNEQNNRFACAISGYQNRVKPSLYERASLALSAVDKPTPTPAPSTPVMWIGPSKWGRLNVTPVSYNETLSPIAGTVGYSVVYNNKPGSWISGALSSTMTVNDTNPADMVAEIFVLGRPLGPVLEKVGTTKSERKLSLEIVFPAPSGYKDSHPNSSECIIYKDGPTFKQIQSLVNSFKPINPNAFATFTNVATSPYSVANQGQVFTTSNTTVWNPFEGRFSWDISWIYNSGLCG